MNLSHRTNHTKSTRGKTHQCCLCARDIIAGERYEKSRNARDGDFYILYTHLDCDELWDEVNKVLDGFLFDDLEDTMKPFYEYDTIGELIANGYSELAERVRVACKETK